MPAVNRRKAEVPSQARAIYLQSVGLLASSCRDPTGHTVTQPHHIHINRGNPPAFLLPVTTSLCSPPRTPIFTTHDRLSPPPPKKNLQPTEPALSSTMADVYVCYPWNECYTSNRWHDWGRWVFVSFMVIGFLLFAAMLL